MSGNDSGARNGSKPPSRNGAAAAHRGRRGGKTGIRAAVDGAKTIRVEAAPPDVGPTRTHEPPGFEKRPDGLYRIFGDGKAPLRISGSIVVVAETRPEDGREWGLLLRWRDRDGRLHDWIMPRSALEGDAAEVRKRLAAGGLDLTGSDASRTALRLYLTTVRVRDRLRTVTRCGWYDGAPGNAAFVLPGRTLGAVPGEELTLDMDPAPRIFRENGSLQGWREGVAGSAAGNSRMVFAIAYGFAAPLLALTGEEGGCIHLRGGSSQGKTTAAKIAASLYGAPTGLRCFIRKWRGTDNGIEWVAVEHCDCLLPMDEIGQADPKVVGPAAYMLADGQGKNRSRAAGGMRETPTWRTLVLSTGEMSLSDYAARAGYVVKAGQEVRFLDVPIDAGAGVARRSGWFCASIRMAR